MEFFRITSRFAAGRAHEGAGPLLGARLQAALLRRAADAFGPRWRPPFDEEAGEAPGRAAGPGFYDELTGGTEQVVLLAADGSAGASQALRAALYRGADPEAGFPPVLVTPDAEAVRTGALQATLLELAPRGVPIYAIDLLGVSGSAMPEALRIVTAAIAREGRAGRPSRWIVLFDPLYERRIGRWSAPEFFGEVRLAHPEAIDGRSLRVELAADGRELRLALSGELASLYLGVVAGSGAGGAGDRLAADVVQVQRVLEAGLEGVGAWETGRRLEMPPLIERLAYARFPSERIDRDAFVDQSLAALLELRAASPQEAVPVAEFVAAYADSHPIEPVPVPEGAGFVETIGRPAAVRRVRPESSAPEDG